MEYRRLQLFLALADELHFRRAATRCNVTPSVLTEQLKRLEDELGGPLFSRTTRSVALTPLGSAFRVEARAALDRLAQAKLAAKHFVAGGNRTLRMSFTPAFMSEIPRVLAAFRALHPETKLFVQEMGTVEAESALGRREIDLALLHPPLDRADLLLCDLQPKPLEAVYDPKVFALRDDVPLQDVLTHPLIWHPHHRAPRLTATLFARAEACGCLPHIVAEAGSWAAAQVMAAGGVGVALLPTGIVTEGRSNAAVSAIDAHPLSLECAVATRRNDADDPLLTDLTRLLSDAATAH
ncbi:LysR family transcriptional regulator [Cognatiyoonia sp. IB215446]|uniref:LysR family transcriptional regulator n=1 Tax=Cognatiyoonia sp. IB215446 TaxID=3097355 RepID=UPI002A0ED0E1|nr:LysR family transcriptional regulator [Cognatiyoonia sp. IB215446]MDX8349117.1 LysR family transcriptional regulator [Cognatiyoonia sp. IB215446]